MGNIWHHSVLTKTNRNTCGIRPFLAQTQCHEKLLHLNTKGKLRLGFTTFLVTFPRLRSRHLTEDHNRLWPVCPTVSPGGCGGVSQQDRHWRMEEEVVGVSFSDFSSQVPLNRANREAPPPPLYFVLMSVWIYKCTHFYSFYYMLELVTTLMEPDSIHSRTSITRALLFSQLPFYPWICSCLHVFQQES